jgi:broad specificity phosphatase PhoE
MKITFDGGESLRDVGVRIREWYGGVTESTVAISHTTAMQVAICIALDLPLDCIWRFAFDHFRFTVLCDNVLVRLNSAEVATFDPTTLRR